MVHFERARIALRGSVCAAAFLCSAAHAGPPSHPGRAVAPATAWDQATHARVAFEAQPTGTHTKLAYTRLLDEFRAIYHDNPRDRHAPDAVFAVAELLTEQGRELEDEKSLKAALGQYEFLRTQYPGSPLREPALLNEARIERDDLSDEKAAHERYNQLLIESPRSESAKLAKADLAAFRSAPTRHDEAVMNGAPERLVVEKKAPQGLKPDLSQTVDGTAEAVALTRQVVAGGTPIGSTKTKALSQVTGIRHWSTSTYTRVAIDLGDDVKFEAARVPNPDRIYFDLHGAKLAPELIGKSFNVTDDGFLKRIRAAQASGDVTRVVLDVSDVTEYSAFLLPNPYRLIIDIHGKRDREEGTGKREEKTEMLAEVPIAAATTASAAANVSGLPPMAPTDGGDAVRPIVPAAPSVVVAATKPAPSPAKPVPNTVAVPKPATTSEVAAVSSSPGKVEATTAPTSKPIVATVPTLKETSVATRATRAKTVATETAAPTKAAEKTADGETSLIRALGLKINRIVIDAGHGGHDSGTLGVDGIQEKDVVLDVALRVGKLLHERLGAEIIYTRSDDTFIPLETRTAIANKAQADLFLSIHANSSQDPTARGVEVYYLNFTSDPTALDVAARENAVSGASVHQLSDLVKKITLKDKIAESREFAADVEGSLFAGLTKGNSGLRDRGVKKAPFVVLIGANMPSILAEISFVTNPRDAEQLREPEYRQRVAESLYAGVAKYESGLAGAKVAAPTLKRASLQ